MSDVFGLTDQGFIPKTGAVIRAEIEARFRGIYGLSLPLGDETIEGQMIGVYTERELLLWELLEILYGTFDPDKAGGQGLKALCLITGTIPPPATFSAVVLTLTGDPTTIVTEGEQATIENTARVFQTTEDATIVAADAWLPTTGYAAGAIVTNADNVYVASVTGISGSGDGPTHVVRSTPDNPITIPADGTVDWIWLGAGTGVIDVPARATVTGPLDGIAYSIDLILTPVSGWLGVVNQFDATPGADEFKDPELRILREVELAQGGTGTIPAVRAALLSIVDVTSATVFYNNTNVTDVDGVPPHSVECVVVGGDDQRIIDTLFDNVPVGIGTVGTTTGTHVDSEGVVHTLKFSRPEEIDIYVVANVIKNSDEYPLDGDEQIKEAIVTYGGAQRTGKNAVASALVAVCFEIDGVLEANALIGIAPAPTLTVTIAINLRQIAKFDTTRITINSSDGVP